MEAAMAITTKYCQKELEEYGTCVVSHPATWQEKCVDLKLRVAQCTSSHPVIRKIRSDCAGEFSVFERCLRENQSSAEACQPHLTRFLACVETVDLSGIANAAPQPT
ncbi:coiled-coil-helix-coiled-coil-helix domain-containing protein 5 [Puntigrus tetrazona]|uniref:coiled-coil-helix-coiled-coil-helix domain-containing protein 5 n=1 Tax=Puntigrus tetrazona TaxID=1606681 RepID=UPI001C896FDA|nr:coiled-coil-helix-coiled-coil-helix domain-containing protein 5 [Puntigrus tetrazona]